MILLKQSEALSRFIRTKLSEGLKIGFVPTMGALHPGHVSLVELSKAKCDVTVCSIFVNPTQFNDKKDFEKYPVTIEQDIRLLHTAGCDVLFMPSVNEMYPEGIDEGHHYELGDLENLLEGKYRPGHFQGVCRIVDKLLKIVTPDFLFIGQKDYQQCLVLTKLVQLLGLNTKIQIGATLRETDGLAMSSRNQRLNEEQRKYAVAIYRMLEHIRQHIDKTPIPELERYTNDYLLNHGFAKVDYVSIADAQSLQPLSSLEKESKAVAVIAAFMGDVRLIDNMMVTE